MVEERRRKRNYTPCISPTGELTTDKPVHIVLPSRSRGHDRVYASACRLLAYDVVIKKKRERKERRKKEEEREKKYRDAGYNKVTTATRR